MNSQQLSTKESEVYDRQLRLWGSSAQMRIKSANVLVIGITASTVEIVKNLVLAGSNLLLEDERKVKESSNFLIQLELDGVADSRVGWATAVAARRLNEHSAVAEVLSSESRTRAVFSRVSAVVVSFCYIDFNLSEALRLSSFARSGGASFFLIMDSSEVTWMFSDFGACHTVEEHTPPLKRDDRTGERKSVQKVEEHEFADLETFVCAELQEKMVSAKSSFPTSQFLFVHFYLRFLNAQSTHEDPSPKRARRSSAKSCTFGEFLTRKVSVLSASTNSRIARFFSTPNSNAVCSSLERIESKLRTECAPFQAAILGALVSQEVIKFVTKRDPPLVNSLVVNPADCGCVVLKHPQSLSSRSMTPPPEDEVELVTPEGEI